MNVWLLSVGCYSNCRVVGAFDDAHKVEAEKIAELINGDLKEEPLRLNHFDCDEPPVGLKSFVVVMMRHGLVRRIDSQSTLDEGGCRWKSCYRVRTHENDPNWTPKGMWRLEVCVYAKHEKHAVKITNDLRAQILAKALPEEGKLP